MPRTLSPRALTRSALNAAIRTLYEDTRVPVREIGRLAGVSERNIYALVRRLGCRTRGRRPVPAEQRIDEKAAAACRRAARAHRKLAAAALSQRQARRERVCLLRTLNHLARAVGHLAAIDRGRAAEAAATAADLDARRRALARRLAAL